MYIVLAQKSNLLVQMKSRLLMCRNVLRVEKGSFTSIQFQATCIPEHTTRSPLLSFPASLIGVEGGNSTRIGRFANYLRNLLPSSDPVVMEMASKAIGRLAMAGDTFTAEYVEFEVKRALEWLGADRNEGRRHAAVSERGTEPSRGWGAVGPAVCFASF